MKLKVYGSRGSMPFFSRENIRYGGNTACFRIDTGGHTIILDCGSGLAQFHEDLKEDIKNDKPLQFDILLSHMHLDHIIGLCTFNPIWNKNNAIRIFTKSRDNNPLTNQVLGIFRPPYWPVDLAKMNNSKIIEVKNDEPFTLQDGIKVTPFKAVHQDDTTSFRIDADKSLVYLLDYELNENPSELSRLVAYCQNADMIIFDSSYLPEDYNDKKGWGHSTYEYGMKLAQMCSCKQMLFAHFWQDYSDTTLNQLADRINNLNPGYRLAFDGMELEI